MSRDRFNAFTATDNPAALEYLAGESGVATLLALTVVAAWPAYRLPARMAQVASPSAA